MATAIMTNNQSEKLLFDELSKGIDDMENGRLVPHDQAMQSIRNILEEHINALQSNRN